jgi:hypothetical protein
MEATSAAGRLHDITRTNAYQNASGVAVIPYYGK